MSHKGSAVIHIAKKEVLEHIRSFRFTVAFLFIVTAFFAIAFTRHLDYTAKYNDYLQQVSDQEEVYGKALHNPMLHGLFLRDIVPPYTMEVLVSPPVTQVLEILDSDPFGYTRADLNITALVGLLGSLLALLLGYDSVNREVNEGTIRLLQSAGISRLRIIVGKVLGGSLAAILPIAVIFLLTAIWMASASSYQWSFDNWVSFSGIFLVSIAYIIFFYSLGTLLSSVIVDSTLSALSCFGVWVIFVVVIPILGPYIARSVVKLPNYSLAKRESNHIYDVERPAAVEAKIQELLAKGMTREEASTSSEVNSIQMQYVGKTLGPLTNFSNLADYQLKISQQLSCISPYTIYSFVVGELSGMSLEQNTFLIAARNDWLKQANDYINQKYKEATSPRLDSTEKFSGMSISLHVSSEGPRKILLPSTSQYSTRTGFGFYKVKLDLSGMPRYQYVEPSLSYRYSHAWPYILLLFAYFIVPLFLYFHAFVTKKKLFRLTFAILFVLNLSIYLYAQGDHASLLYNVKQAEISVSTMRLDYESKARLHEAGLLSTKEFEEVKNRYQSARLNYVYALIRATSGSFYVSVEKAVKYQKPDGTKWVRLTLLNSLPDLGKTIDEFLGTEGEESLSNYKDLYNNEIRNVFLSIEKDDVLVGQPLEYKINSLNFGEKRDFDFQIMRDMDEVVVALRYDLNTVERRKVFLRPSNETSRLILTPENFSVESNLGEKAVYRISLERYLTGSSVIKLSIPDLSSQFQYDVYEGDTRISDLNFKENDFKKDLTLNVYLPARESTQVSMDSPIEFSLVASEQALIEGKPQTIEGSAKLLLIPRGMGKIEIKADNLFLESTGTDTVSIPLKIANAGSRDILDVELTIRGGVGWENAASPTLISNLKPQAESAFSLSLKPPGNVHPGEYDFRVAVKGLSNGQPVYAEEKTFRVKVNAKTNWFVIVAGTALSLALIGGTVYGAMKIMKN